MDKKKVMVAMSGGVDSSVAAYLVQEAGYEACGITLKLYTNEEIGMDKQKTCCSLEDINDARFVANHLGIPYYVFNFTDHFGETVIDKFIQTYQNGGTPNPCIDCNRFVKFSQLLRRAEAVGFDFVATGHYAQTGYNSHTNRWFLKKAADSAKDQTYVLYNLTQEQLKKTLFPLGALRKDAVRELAERLSFVNAKKADSQDICFVPHGDYGRFIEEYTGQKSLPGDFVDTSGHVLGQHKGIIYYTIGQRKGLGLSLKQPMYVVEKDVARNRVVLGFSEDLYSKSLTATDVNFIACEEIKGPIRVQAKTRYNQTEEEAIAEQIGPNRIRVTFEKPQRAVTRGQAVVLYDGDEVIGGGTIE